MYPILFKIGSFPVHTYGVVMIVAFMVALVFARKRAPAYEINPNKLSDMSFLMLIFGVLGARILYLVQEPPADWHEYLSLQFAGLTSFGGIIGGAAVALWWARKTKTPLKALLDVLGPALLVGQAIGRVGCLLNGCCLGGVCPTGLPWGVHAPGSDHLFHPAQIYESIMNLAGLGVVLLIEKRGLRPGQVFALAIATFGISRFIYEFWRAGTEAQVKIGLASSTYWDGLPITQAQAVAGLIILMGIGLFFLNGRKARVPEQEPIPA
jgi:phosphatidylglycerol---prolipoprotein diacylglyceryl transferase